jgi:hypothetical protein
MMIMHGAIYMKVALQINGGKMKFKNILRAHSDYTYEAPNFDKIREDAAEMLKNWASLDAKHMFCVIIADRHDDGTYTNTMFGASDPEIEEIIIDKSLSIESLSVCRKKE